MTPLDRKLLRDLGHHGAQAISIALLVACGVATLVGSAATARALARTQARYYDQHRYAHVFARLRAAPEPVAARLAALPGVAEVETRVVGWATLELPGGASGVTAVVQSLPPGGARLNVPYLRAGRSLAPGRTDEVLVSEGLAEANGLAPGDRVALVVNGRRHPARVAGVALSPEHVYVVRPGDLFPDDRHHGVVWMPRAALASALDLAGAFDEVSLRLAPGATEPEVIAGVDRILAPFGGLGAGGRDRQVSHRFLTDEIAQLRTMAAVVPALFLAVAAFLVGVVLSRLVATQRPVIGMLKALGYRDREVAGHYARFVAAIALGGAALGVGGGVAMGRALARSYAAFYRLPSLAFDAGAGTAALAVAVALLASLGGGLAAVRRAAALPPAEAMRPAAPPAYRASGLERLGLAGALPPAARMVLRDLARRPWRTAASAGGLAMAVALLVVSGFARDALALILDLQLVQAERQDLTVTFTDPRAPGAARELAALPGVHAVEPFRTVPVVLRRGHRSYRTGLSGLDPGGGLARLVDRRGHAVAIPPDGLVISGQLGHILDARPGDALEVQVLEERRPAATIRVSAWVDDLLGVQAACAPEVLRRALGGDARISGARLAVEPAAQRSLEDRLRALPRVAGVTSRAATRAAFQALVADLLLAYMAVIAALALLVAAGVVYTAARVTWSERERELATLRVIGFRRGEVWRVLAGELAVHAALGLPAGCGLGVALVALVAAAAETDLYRLPVVVAPGTQLVAALAVGAAALVVALVTRRWVRRLDLVEVLKARE